MSRLKHNYSVKYMPEINITVLHMTVFDDDDISEYTFAVDDKLSNFDIEQHYDFMYFMATSDQHKRKVELGKIVEFE